MGNTAWQKASRKALTVPQVWLLKGLPDERLGWSGKWGPGRRKITDLLNPMDGATCGQNSKGRLDGKSCLLHLWDIQVDRQLSR